MRAPVVCDRKLETVVMDEIDSHRRSLVQQRLDLVDAGFDPFFIKTQINQFVRGSALVIDKCADRGRLLEYLRSVGIGHVATIEVATAGILRKHMRVVAWAVDDLRIHVDVGGVPADREICQQVDCVARLALRRSADGDIQLFTVVLGFA